MDSFVALMRGINVGGKNKLPMSRLVAFFSAAGAKNARTYIQSGNVVFEGTARLAVRLPVLLREEFGVPAVIRGMREVRAVAENNPFLSAGAKPEHLHVAFLADAPTPKQIAGLDPDRSPPDAFDVRGSAIYLHCPNGMARTKLTNAYFDSRLATTSTVRNWRTVLRILLTSLCLLSSTAHADAARRKTPVVEVVQRVSPAVVHIGTEQIADTRFRQNPMDQFFDDFFGLERKQSVQSLGSGVILDPSGIIVTNDHVIRGATAIHIVLADGRQIDADVIGSDADNDLAVLKVQVKAALPAAKLGTSNDLMIGETVVAIGSPFGLSKSVTSGVISAIGRSFRANDRVYNDFLQTDAAINPGNSGGPLMNIDGEVIGINTAIFASAQGIGFAIPADKVRRIVSELAQFGKVRPAWVGIEAQALRPPAARAAGWDKTYGAVVVDLEKGSPAEKAGLQRGDIITDLGGARIEDAEDLVVRLKGYPARASFSVSLFRGGATKTVSVTPVEFPASYAAALAWERLGLRVRPTTGGLLITHLRARSPAARVGLEPGDGLVRLNNQPLPSAEAFQDALLAAKNARSVLLLVLRGGRGYHVTLPF